MGTSTFNLLTITGDISSEVVPANVKVPNYSYKFLILGPTGTGKSTFVEALAGKGHSLAISRDQLAGYTQYVNAYRLANAFWGTTIMTRYPIYLVDTPGFSDTKISEKEIMDMLRGWLANNELSYFDRILYLTSISEPRLAGSKRRTIEMLKSFLKPSGSLSSMVFVTTMWDRLHSEKTQQRAQANFSQLRNDILKEFVYAGAEFVQFRNTRQSALQILDTGFYCDHADLRTAAPLASSQLYYDLHERIEGALQHKKVLEADLADPKTHDDLELKSILEQSHRENGHTLAKFIAQFVKFEEPPVGFHNAAQSLRKTIAAEVDPRAIGIKYQETFEFWAKGLKLPKDLYLDHPSRTLVIEGVLRRMVKRVSRRGSKWFKIGS